MSEDLDRWRVLALAGVVIWTIIIPWLAILMYRTLSRKGGPFTVGYALTGLANLFEAGFYLWTLHHLGGNLSQHGVDVVLWSVIYRGVVQFGVIVYITWRAFHRKGDRNESD